METSSGIDDDAFRRFKAIVFNDSVSDLTGVYEVWWDANGTFPDTLLSERLALAERAVNELLAAGLVDLYRGTLTDPELVPPVEQEATLRAWATWSIPDGPKVFIFGEAPSDPAAWATTLDSL